MPTLWFGVRMALTYVVLIAFGTFVVSRWIASDADIARLWTGLLLVQSVGAAFVVLTARAKLNWVDIGFGRLHWRGLIWLTPATLVLGAMIWSVVQQDPRAAIAAIPAGVWALVVLTPFLIAFSEEVIFRGVLLRGAMRRYPIVYAMLLSAFAFAVAHLINGLAGQPLINTVLQSTFALLVGVALAPIALLLGNLWPLIIWHWLWNIVVLSSQIMQVIHPLTLIGIAIQAVVSIWLWTRYIRDETRA